jgi:hypothetical protein
MKGDILFQNIFTLFLIAIILECSISAFFSISLMENFRESTVGKSVREIVILLLAFFICWKVKKLTLFGGTGITIGADLKIHDLFDSLIAALVVSRIAFFIRDLANKIKENS